MYQFMNSRGYRVLFNGKLRVCVCVKRIRGKYPITTTPRLFSCNHIHVIWAFAEEGGNLRKSVCLTFFFFLSTYLYLFLLQNIKHVCVCCCIDLTSQLKVLSTWRLIRQWICPWRILRACRWSNPKAMTRSCRGTLRRARRWLLPVWFVINN